MRCLKQLPHLYPLTVNLGPLSTISIILAGPSPRNGTLNQLVIMGPDPELDKVGEKNAVGLGRVFEGYLPQDSGFRNTKSKEG
jgi:hypothetical protein